MTAYQAPPSVGDPTSVMGRRIFAYLIDFTLLVIALAVVLVPIFNDVSTKTIYASSERAANACDVKASGELCFVAGDEVYRVASDKVGDLSAPFYGVIAAWLVIDMMVIAGLAGGSIGKLVVGLRVVKGDTGEKAGIGAHVIRALGLILDAGCCLIGLITSFTTKGHRRVGDLLASTNVVRSNDVGRPPMAPVMADAYGTPGQWTAPPGAPGAPGAPGWGAPAGPAAPGSWAPPAGSSPGAVPPAPADAPPAAPAGDGPQWDAARNAYIQFDRAQNAWVQFDDASQTWKPISQ